MQTQIDLILSLLGSKQLEQAVISCENLVAEYPDTAQVHNLLGLSYAQAGFIEKAWQSLKQAIDLDPRQAIFHNNISNIYKKLGNLEYAQRHLHQALLLEPNNAESYNNLGSLYYTQKLFPTAIPFFEKAIRLNPRNWEAHYNLANSYIKTEMVLQAISHYQTVLELNPQHGNAKLNLAMAFVSLNNYVAATPLLEEAAQLNPQHAELQGHLAEAYVDLGRSAEAIAQYNKALALEPTRAAWHHNLAVLYLRDKQNSLAQQHFKYSLELEPNNQTAIHMLQALNNEDNTREAASTAPAEYVSNLFDQYAGYYNQHVKNKLNYKVPELLRQAISKYVNDFSTTQNVLDLGCGTGLCGIYFRDIAEFLIGVDLSAEMLARAKSLGAYDGLCRGDILQVIPGFNRQVFDIILAADVLVYIGDLRQVFVAVKSAMRPQAKFAFTVEHISDEHDYILQKSGRYAHSDRYLHDLAREFNLSIGIQDQITLRTQDDQAVIGTLFVLVQ